jgi:hypothetical protein
MCKYHSKFLFLITEGRASTPEDADDEPDMVDRTTVVGEL